MKHVAKTVIERGGKYLLIQRKTQSKFFPDQWDFPGGKLELNETPTDAAIRETKEETSLDINLGKIVLEGEHTERETVVHYTIFLTSGFKGEISLSKDHTHFKWLSKEEIKIHKTTPFVNNFFANA